MITVLLATLPFNLTGATLSGATGTPPQKVNSSDQQVIQQALLSFFRPEPWHSGDWRPKKHVVLNPSYQNETRAIFTQAVRPMLFDLRQDRNYLMSEQRKKPELRRVSAAILAREIERNKKNLAAVEAAMSPRKAVGKFNYPPVTPLSSFRWDPRIKLTDRSGRRSYGDQKVDKTLEPVTVYAQAKPPAYSVDGQYVLVEFSIPWSKHSADVQFLFQRNGAGWRQVCVVPIFYV